MTLFILRTHVMQGMQLIDMITEAPLSPGDHDQPSNSQEREITGESQSSEKENPDVGPKRKSKILTCISDRSETESVHQERIIEVIDTPKLLDHAEKLAGILVQQGHLPPAILEQPATTILPLALACLGKIHREERKKTKTKKKREQNGGKNGAPIDALLKQIFRLNEGS